MEKRMIIYSTDVAVLTGKSERYGRSIIRMIKRANGKTRQQLVTVEEFCLFTGVDVAEVKEKLNLL